MRTDVPFAKADGLTAGTRGTDIFRGGKVDTDVIDEVGAKEVNEAMFGGTDRFGKLPIPMFGI